MATSQELLDQIQVQNIRYMQNLVTRAQTDPRSLSDEELAKAYQFGQQLGVDMKNAQSKDKATFFENAKAFGGGALDSLLFGILPNELYSDYRSKQARNMGQLFGDALSFAVPAFGVGAGAKMLFKGVKGLKGLAGAKKAIKAGDIVSDAVKALNKADDIVDVAKVADKAGDIAGAVNKSDALIKAEKQLERAKKASDKLDNALETAKFNSGLKTEQAQDVFLQAEKEIAELTKKIPANKLKNNAGMQKKISQINDQAQKMSDSLLDEAIKFDDLSKTLAEKIPIKKQDLMEKAQKALDDARSIQDNSTRIKISKVDMQPIMSKVLETSNPITKTVSRPFMQTPLKELGGQFGQTTSSITEVAKEMGKQSWERASMLTPQEILNMAKAIVQGTRTMNNAYGSVMPSKDLSQTNPYLMPADMNGMPPL